MKSWISSLAALATIALAPVQASAAPGLWSLSDEDTTIYLFGTIHALPEGVDWRSAEMDAAFSDARTFCIETDVIANADEIMMLTFREGVFRGSERLSDYLDEEQQADLQEIAQELHLVYPSLDVMKPWNAMFTVAAAFAIKAGFSDALGVESVLYDEAIADGKFICEMETPREHVMSIAGLPIEVQIAALTEEDPEDEDKTIAELIEEEKLEFYKMVDEWVAGDIEALADDRSDFGHPEFYDAILTRRNAAWVVRIEEMLLEPGVIFIAVGAAHLAGPDSVQAMLRERGYTVLGPDHPALEAVVD